MVHLFSAKGGEGLIIDFHVESLWLAVLAASVVAAAVALVPGTAASTASTASAASSVIVSVSIIKEAASAAAALEAQILAIDHELFVLSLVAAKLALLLYVNLLGFDLVSFKLLAVVGLSCFNVRVATWRGERGHILFESQLNLDWLLWLLVLFLGRLVDLLLLLVLGLVSHLLGWCGLFWVFGLFAPVALASATSLFGLALVAGSWVTRLSVVTPSSIVGSWWSAVLDLTLVVLRYSTLFAVSWASLLSWSASLLLVSAWLSSWSVVSSVVDFLLLGGTGDGGGGGLLGGELGVLLGL